ncbi:MAG: hypothetical protein IJM63_09700 [Solobacterium sp.]|nr:hypothetical protein [Solobacterium sp.]
MKKMYSDMDNPDVQMLMKLIEKRDLQTVIRWIAACSEAFLCPSVSDVRELADLLKKTDLSKEDKAVIKSMLTAMRKRAAAEKDPALQASLRAVSTGAAVISTPSGALGFVLYLSVAAAYHACDPKDEETCMREAEAVIHRCRVMLEETPEAEEGKALKVKWNC